MRRILIHLRQKPKSRGRCFSASWQWRFVWNVNTARVFWPANCLDYFFNILPILCHKLFIIYGSFNDAVNISLSNSSWPNLKYSPAFVWGNWGNPQKPQSSCPVSLSNLKAVPPEYQAGKLANATLSSNTKKEMPSGLSNAFVTKLLITCVAVKPHNLPHTVT
jgi:hypothetical protein